MSEFKFFEGVVVESLVTNVVLSLVFKLAVSIVFFFTLLAAVLLSESSSPALKASGFDTGEIEGRLGLEVISEGAASTKSQYWVIVVGSPQGLNHGTSSLHVLQRFRHSPRGDWHIREALKIGTRTVISPLMSYS